ncbi:MAG: hypothetical protein EXR68_00440 [Dehalococcoidia bacterium]|nr:hypothetical protein [Dehalococcoidia bacterium]
MFASDVIDHNAALGQAPGRESLKQLNGGFRTALPDTQMTIDDMIAEGDKIVWRWTAQGTHLAPLMGIPPTNKRVTISGISSD